MERFRRPGPTNDFLAEHASLLQRSYHHWTGRHLLEGGVNPKEAARQLFNAPFAVVSHDTAPDPVFNYANLAALQLFEMSWEQFTSLPSRSSAEPITQAERARLLQRVSDCGFIEDYTGVRIARSGKRFLIRNATVWNLLDQRGHHGGQAAMFTDWEHL